MELKQSLEVMQASAIIRPNEMALRKDKASTVGTSTPITIGLALALLVAIVGFGFQAGALANKINVLSDRLAGIESREEKNSKTNIDLITKLTRIETLLEGVTATVARLEREKR